MKQPFQKRFKPSKITKSNEIILYSLKSIHVILHIVIRISANGITAPRPVGMTFSASLTSILRGKWSVLPAFQILLEWFIPSTPSPAYLFLITLTSPVTIWVLTIGHPATKIMYHLILGKTDIEQLDQPRAWSHLVWWPEGYWKCLYQYWVGILFCFGVYSANLRDQSNITWCIISPQWFYTAVKEFSLNNIFRGIYWSLWSTIWSNLLSIPWMLGKYGHSIFYTKVAIWLLNKLILFKSSKFFF